MDNKKKIKLNRCLKAVIFTLLWSIIIIKLFKVDIELKILENVFPEMWDILLFRIFIYAVPFLIVCYTIGIKSFFINLLYFVRFPFYLVFWIIPKVLLWDIPRYFLMKKYWIMMYSYVGSIIRNLLRLRYKFFKIALFICGLVLVITTDIKPVLYIVLASQLFLLIVLIIEKFKIAFSPITFFTMGEEYSTSKDAEVEKDELFRLIPVLKNTEIVDNQNGIKIKQLKNIEFIVLVKSLLAFLSLRLKDFLSRRTYIILFFFKVLVAFVFAWILLTLMNYVVYKISYSEYSFQVQPQFHIFIFYTFHSMLHGSIHDIIPSGTLANIINIIAPCISLLISGILLTVFISVKSDQYQENIKEVIEFTNMLLKGIDEALNENYKLTIDEANTLLESRETIKCRIIKEINKIM
ncbi:MAG: hypothetical protein GX109_08250 [Bacteroidales bacterium]|jgi:hypothetical protein|nr:hypothetical protein [Bacteroidales bacterium]